MRYAELDLVREKNNVNGLKNCVRRDKQCRFQYHYENLANIFRDCATCDRIRVIHGLNMDIDRLKKKKDRAKRESDFCRLAAIVKDLGDLYFETGDLEAALQEYLEQLDICDRLKDKLNGAIAHRMIGEVYASLGDYQQALVHQQLHLDAAREMENSLEKQRALATLGRTYFCFAESLTTKDEKYKEALMKAKEAYTSGIHLCQRLEKTNIDSKELIVMRARIYLNLGLVLDAQNERSSAVDLVQQAASLCENHNVNEDFYRTQIALAGIHERHKDYESALKYLKRASDIDDMTLKTEALLSKAELLLKIEDWQESRKVLVFLYTHKELPSDAKQRVDRLLRIVVTLQDTDRNLCDETDSEKQLYLYETLGDAAVAAKCFDKAIEYYSEMLRCAKECGNLRTGAALVSLAQTLKDIGRNAEAVQYAHEELQLCTDPREICRSALFLADLLLDVENADINIREIYDLARTKADISGDLSLQKQVYDEMSYYYKKYGELEEFQKLKQLKESLQLTASSDTEESNLPKCGSQSSDSENDDSESILIGADICLEDLPDVEEAIKSMEAVKRSKTRIGKATLVKRNAKGETQLHVACIAGNIDAVNTLLSSGHPVNVRDHFGWTPLHEAANHGHVEVARLLLDNGANINDPGAPLCRGVTPLHDAASCGNISMVTFLMERGANVSLETQDGDTVLDCLEQWRSRAGTLSSDDLADYLKLHTKLSTILPRKQKILEKNREKNNEPPKPSCSKHVDGKCSTEAISAGEDYRRTIESLKHRADPLGKSLGRVQSDALGPLLDQEEEFLDNWLEDDLKENLEKKKSSRDSSHVRTKRKFDEFEVDSNQTLKRSKISTISSFNSDEILGTTSLETATTAGNSLSSIDIEEVDTDSNDQQLNSPQIDVTAEEQLAGKKKQMSLLSVGFTRDLLLRTSPPSTQSGAYVVDVSTSEEIMLNVSIETTSLKFGFELPSDHEQTLPQLLAVIETKFYSETGCKGSFRIKTMDDALLTYENTATLLLGGGKSLHLKGQIIELSIPSLAERYQTICQTYGTAVRDFVLKCLKSCESTPILRLQQEEMNADESACILRALLYQKNVQVLRFTGGDLRQAGSLLNTCFIQFSILREVYLESSNIDFQCLSQITSFPCCLKLLDLSYNPLRSESQEVLKQLLTPLEELHTLNLRYCELENFQLPSNFPNLLHLDISWNGWKDEVPALDTKSQLLDLNLSGTIQIESRNYLSKFWQRCISGSCMKSLEFLDFSYCDLTDSEVSCLLEQSPSLVKIVLTGNKQVTIKSANSLLKRRRCFEYVDLAGCETIVFPPDHKISLENPQGCKFLASIDTQEQEAWIQLWRGESVTSTLPGNLLIVKN